MANQCIRPRTLIINTYMVNKSEDNRDINIYRHITTKTQNPEPHYDYKLNKSNSPPVGCIVNHLTIIVGLIISILISDKLLDNFVVSSEIDTDAVQPVHVPIFLSEHHFLSLGNLSSLSFNTIDTGHDPLTTKSPPLHSTSSAFGIDRLTRALQAKLSSLRNTELAVPAIQHIFDAQHDAEARSNKPTPTLNDTQLAAQFALRLENTLQLAQFAINDANRIISQNSFAKLPTVVQPCPIDDWATALDQHYDKTQIEIKNYRAPADRNANWTDEEKAAHGMVMQALKAFRTGQFAFQRAFFLSNSDVAGQHVCTGTSVQEFGQLRSVLASSINQKNLMVLIDHGGSLLNVEQLELTKAFGKYSIVFEIRCFLITLFLLKYNLNLILN